MAFGRGKDDGNPFGAAAPSSQALKEDDVWLRRRRALRFDLLLMVLFVVLSLGGTALALVREERKNLDDPVQQAERGEVVGAEGLSLIREPNFTRALGLVAARLKPDEIVTNIRLAPDLLTVQARDTEGDQRIFGVGLDYELRLAEDAGESSDDGERGLAAVDRGAPERFVRAVQRRTRFSADKLEYLVYDPGSEGDPADWSAYFDDVPIAQKNWRANGQARYVRLPSEPDPEAEAERARASALQPILPAGTDVSFASLTVTRDGETRSYRGEEALAVARCIREARRDADAILECIR